jgi:O-succinylbenzoic acid--CoA ligase
MTPLQLQNCVANNSLSKIRKVIVGGAPLSNRLKENIQLFSSLVYETYGMTETASHIALRKLNGTDKSDHFRVLAGISVTTNADSQLIISSNGLKLKNLVTNDIVRLLDPDSFVWLGRKDNIINSGGIKLFPELIESKLKPEIENDFFVFGMSSEKFGQSPAIVIEGDTRVDLTDIFHRNLEKYEIPKKIFYVDNFIRTESGKINRNETIAASLLFQ